MRKILWLGLAMLALVLVVLVWTTSEPADPSPPSATVFWAPWLALVSLGAIALLAFRGLARHQAQATAAGTNASSAAPATTSSPAAPPSPAPLHILDAAVATVAGHDTATVLQALCEKPPLPEPDPELPDANGMPRLSARCKDLDLNVVTSVLPADMPTLRPAVLRALALQAVALEALQPSSSQPLSGDGLDVLWMVPSHWSEAERSQASAWLQTALAAYRPDPPQEPCIHMLGASTAATTLQRLRVHAGALRSSHPRTGQVIALACDSLLDGTLPSAASRADADLPPGEAAAAVVLWRPGAEAPSTHPADCQSTLGRLATPGQGTEQDKPTHAGLRGMAARVLDDPGRCEQVGWAVSDVGLSGRPAREVLDSLVERLPHLDMGERLCRLGAACGDLGAAGPLVAVALASRAATEAPTVLLLSGPEPAVALLTPSKPSAASA